MIAHSSKTAERAYVRFSITELGSKALHIIERVTAGNDKQTQDDSEDSRGKNDDNTATTSAQETFANVQPKATSKPTDGSEDSEGPNRNTAAATSTLGRTAIVETTAATEQEQDLDCEEAAQPSNPTETASTSSYSVSLVSTAVTEKKEGSQTKAV